jgi:two-component system, cell cycle sensor histidine kinase and response regulator CckA
MGIPLRVLFIEDSPDAAELQVRLLRKAGYDIEYERVDEPDALKQLLEKSRDLIISDYSMSHFRGTDALRLIRQLGLETPFFFVSGSIGEETAVEALKMGAQDYLMKANLNRLIPAVQRELRETEERKQRRRLELQVHQLRRFEAVGRLAGGVAHDFNNVIAAIMGWAEIGSSEASPDSLVQDRFHKIRRQAERAATLTRQLLGLAQRQLLQPCDTNLNELVRDEITRLQNAIGDRNSIELNLAEDLLAIRADPGQIEQMIMNLCLNARDAMPNGGQPVISTENALLNEDRQRIHEYAGPGRYVHLRVRDTGVGMDPDTLEHIFEPFFTTKEEDKGTGLGLATVYGIVKQHKGFIEVESAKGIGTTFRVYLPAAEGLAPAARQIAEVRLQRGTETILIAEDNEDVREATRQILEHLGYKIFAARNGAEAVELFSEVQSSVDLVFLDVIMPVLNGPEASARISAIRPDIPFIFTTGYATESNPPILHSIEKAAILQKPFDTVQLVNKLREVLDRRDA